MAEPNKQKILEDTIREIKDRFGDGAIMKLGDARKVNVDVIPSGSLALDLALGVGGYPKGRIVEIFGPESSGKTTLALHAVAEVQRREGLAAFIDAEHALDPDYARRLGVKVEDLFLSQPDTGEQALEIVESLVRSGAIDLVVIDSVAALVPRAEIEGEMGEQHMALQARLMSQALRKLTAVTSKVNVTIIFLNQMRMKIGIVFGNPETTTGGMALKFYSSVRVEVRRAAQIKKGDTVVGNRIKVKVVKNKVAAPFQTAEFDIMYNEGISREGDLLTMGTKYEIITKSGLSYYFGEQKLGTGVEQVRAFLKENSEVAEDIRRQVREKAEVRV
ncbi:MAG: recombinase RecA [bacterium]|nr:recombinase RecA [bacterium]MDZ4296342.1 recombinase RecA [Patescibacteria group bacterium]